MKIIKYIYTKVENTFHRDELVKIAEDGGHAELAWKINKFYDGQPSICFIAMLGKERIWLDSAYRIGTNGSEAQCVPFDVFRALLFHFCKTLQPETRQ